MSELTFKIEHLPFNTKELEEYITSLNGVKEVKINSDDEIYINYDYELISIKVLILEVKLFLSLLRIPSVIEFDKHSKENTVKTTLNIENACCEYCVKGFIEDLALIDGIKQASTDYNDDTFNVSIEISYDKTKINENTIKELVDNYNN